jgi:hypothetical protein
METIENHLGLIEAQQAVEESRRLHEAATQKRHAKLEMIRLAKEVLLENARHQTTEYVPVTAAAVTVFAEELTQYVGD